MSILLADILPTTLPASTTQPGVTMDTSVAILWISVGWAAVGLLAAYLLGAFRRQSIVGPERLAPTESAWDLFIVFFFVYLGSNLAAGMFLQMFPRLSEEKLLLLQGVVNLVSIIAIVLLLERIRPGAVRLLGFDLTGISRGLAGGAATVFVLYPLIQLSADCVGKLYERFHFNSPKPHELLQVIGTSQNRGLTVFAILLACVLAPLAEELCFRALLQTTLVRFFDSMSRPTFPSVSQTHQQNLQGTLPLKYEAALMPISSTSVLARWAAVVTTSALFAAIHMQPAFFCPLFVLALGLGYAYERTGNLWVTITAHALFNTAQILLFLGMGR